MWARGRACIPPSCIPSPSALSHTQMGRQQQGKRRPPGLRPPRLRLPPACKRGERAVGTRPPTWGRPLVLPPPNQAHHFHHLPVCHNHRLAVERFLRAHGSGAPTPVLGGCCREPPPPATAAQGKQPGSGSAPTFPWAPAAVRCRPPGRRVPSAAPPPAPCTRAGCGVRRATPPAAALPQFPHTPARPPVLDGDVLLVSQAQPHDVEHGGGMPLRPACLRRVPLPRRCSASALNAGDGRATCPGSPTPAGRAQHGPGEHSMATQGDTPRFQPPLCVSLAFVALRS